MSMLALAILYKKKGVRMAKKTSLANMQGSQVTERRKQSTKAKKAFDMKAYQEKRRKQWKEWRKWFK